MKKTIILLLAMATVLLPSCSSYKRIAYLMDMEPGVEYNAQDVPEAVIRKNDRLKIFVTCSNPVLSTPFNMAIGTQPVNEEYGTVTENRTAEDMKVYVVDNAGCINFPVLGNFYVEGMTLSELKDSLADNIVSIGYLKDPIVLASFQNFKVTIMGEAGPTILNVEDGYMNIFDALARSGGASSSAKLNDIWVIRTSGGKRVAYSINLQSVSCFDSPAYYLQQNDMIYVKPRESKMDDAKTTAITIFNLVLTTMNTISNVLFWLKR